jgi:hypothetical protein
MTVDEMIKRLKVISKAGNGDHELFFHEKGACWDIPVSNVFKDTYDMKHGKKRITIK